MVGILRISKIHQGFYSGKLRSLNFSLDFGLSYILVLYWDIDTCICSWYDLYLTQINCVSFFVAMILHFSWIHSVLDLAVMLYYTWAWCSHLEKECIMVLLVFSSTFLIQSSLYSVRFRLETSFVICNVFQLLASLLTS